MNDASRGSRRLALVALALLAAVAAGTCGGSGTPDGPFKARVTRVVDGDTIVVDGPGGGERVRYIGVDTPESVKPNTPVQCYAKVASHLNEKLVAGKTVLITPGREKRDRYGRLLAYVRTEGGIDVNAELLKEGAARTLTISPNTERASEYADLEARARNQQSGMWGVCVDAQNRENPLLGSEH